MKPAAAAWPVTAAMVGIGRARRSAIRLLKREPMEMIRAWEAAVVGAAFDQAMSKPFEKKRPCAVMIKARPPDEE